MPGISVSVKSSVPETEVVFMVRGGQFTGARSCPPAFGDGFFTELAGDKPQSDVLILQRMSRGWALFFAAMVVVGSSADGALAGPGGPTHLTTEYAAPPVTLGLDDPHPRLAWWSPVQQQTAYQLRVATSLKALQGGAGLLWDSGRIASADSTQVDYQGPPLAARTRYFWQVRVWDENDRGSPFSQPSWWETGLLQPSDWTGRWIGGRQTLDHDWGDFTATFDFTLSGESVEFLFRARPVGKSYGETYSWEVALVAGKPTLRARVRQYPGGRKSDTKMTTLGEFPLATDTPGFWARKHQMVIEAIGDRIKTSVDGKVIGTIVDTAHGRGTIGFRSEHPSAAIIHRVVVTVAGRSAFETAFAAGGNPFTGGSPAADGLVVAAGAPGKDIMLPIATPAPLLRKGFVLPRAGIERARLHVAAGGWPAITLNGGPVGDGPMENGYTDYDRRVLYRTYDVTKVLKVGDNALGVELGRGWYGLADPNEWYWHMAAWHGQPRLRAQLEITFVDGTRQVIVSDDEWRTLDGPTTYDSLYGGEHHDARLSPRGWRAAGFDDHAWGRATLVDEPKGAIVAAQLEPIKRVGSIKAVTIRTPRPGVHVFDFGRVIAGTVRMKVSGPRGQTVSLIHTEKLRADGTVDPEQRLIDTQIQTDRYTLGGGAPEVWEPAFNYKGFRYVQVEGFPGQPKITTLLGNVIHSAVGSHGTFDGGNPLLNKIQQAARNTLLNNTHGFVTDTPTYEKNGWTGDAQASSLAAVLNFDMARVWTKWLADFRDAQSEKGEIPEIVPTTSYYGYEHTPGWSAVEGPTPSWDAATFVLPWELYTHQGDRRILDRMYDTHRRLVDYTGTFINAENGYTHNRGLGEYSSAGPAGPIDATAVAYFYFMTDRLAKSAGLLGKGPDTARYRTQADKIRDAYNARYWDAEQKIYRTRNQPYSQTQNTLPLAFGMVPAGNEKVVVSRLNDDLVARKYHLSAGIYASRFLLTILGDYGFVDTAYQVATQTTLPSWGWWIANGHATMFEGWSLDSRSHDHHYWSLISSWFFQSLAGLRPGPDGPGYKTVMVKPAVPKGLQRASGTLATLRGQVASSWTHGSDGSFRLRVAIPGNTSAEVWVPGATATATANARFVRQEPGYAVYRMRSGKATFLSRF